jgi:hypothetical protein
MEGAKWKGSCTILFGNHIALKKWMTVTGSSKVAPIAAHVQ